MNVEKLPRVYAPDALAVGHPVTLSPEESGHLTRVLRRRAGARVQIFDGRGHEFAGAISSIARGRVVVVPASPLAPVPEPPVPVTLGQAVLTGTGMDDVVRDAVMLGVAVIQPLLSDRVQSPAAVLGRGRRVERWRRIAVASAKQCGRAVVPEVRPALGFVAYLAADSAACRLMLVEPAARQASGPLCGPTGLPAAPSAATILVGPEGGWSPREVTGAVSAGFQLQTLGARTLRADAVPLVALAILQAAWGGL